jgi:hypothetical protein
MAKEGYHKTKSGKMAKKGLYYNINQKKKAGTSKTKAKSTISDKAYANRGAQYGDKNKITRGDIIAAAKKNKKKA